MSPHQGRARRGRSLAALARRSLTGMVIASVLTASALGALSDSPSVHAATLATECAADQGFAHCAAFGYGDEPQLFTVPEGVSVVSAKVWGAGAGANRERTGASGGYTTGQLAVGAGQVLAVTPGAGGRAAITVAQGAPEHESEAGGDSEVRIADSGAGPDGRSAKSSMVADGGSAAPEPRAATEAPHRDEIQYVTGTAAGGTAEVAGGAGGNGLVVLQWNGAVATGQRARRAAPGEVGPGRAESPAPSAPSAPGAPSASASASAEPGGQPSWSAVAARATAPVPSARASETPDGTARSAPAPGTTSTVPERRAPGDSLDCTGRVIYAYQRGANATANGTLLALSAPSLAGSTPATVTATAVSTVPGAGFANALGIGGGGTAAYLVRQTPLAAGSVDLYGYSTATDTWTTYTGSATGPADNFVAGAIDPANGIYYYADYTNGTATLYGFDTTTHTAIPGIVATFPLPISATGGSNGDLAFDAAGNLYALSSLGTTAAIGRVDGPLPTTGSATGTRLTSTTVSVIDNPGSASYNGIAFDNGGHLFVEYTDGSSTFLKELDPNSGALINGPKPYSDNAFLSVDLGACSTNPTVELQKDVVGRFVSSAASNDQFTLSITGGGIDDGNTATTTGTATGVQPVSAGPLIAVSGTQYTLGESGAAGGSLANYTTTYGCVDTANGNAPVASGSGSTFTLPFPPTVDGFNSPAVLCTLTNTPVAQNPALTIVKSVNASRLTAAGQVLGYDFLVTNTGNVTLTDVGVSETSFTGSGPAPTVLCPPAAASLAPGASVLCAATYTVTQDDIDRSTIDNTAVATGTPPGGPPVTSPPSSAHVPNTPAPALTLVKSADPTTVTAAGQSVTYGFLVTNTGNVTLRTVTVTETAFSGTGTPPVIGCPVATLPPGAATTCTATYAVTQADIDAGKVTNTAVATGTPPTGPPVTTPPSDAIVTATPAPAITIVKSVDPGTVSAAGQSVAYAFLVTNTGNVTLTGVAVTESAFSGTGTAPAITCPAGAASLAPGAAVTCTASYTVTQADVNAGSVTNSAVATGTPPTGPPVTSPPSNAVVIAMPTPALTIVKSVDAAQLTAPGQTLAYAFLVTNTGNVTLTGVSADETAFTGSGTAPTVTCPAGAASLAPGASVTCTASYTVTQADIDRGTIDNTAVATGTPPVGPPVTSPPSSASVPGEPTPALTIAKSASPATVTAAGQSVAYSFVVTNTGNVTLTDVAVTETAFSGTGTSPAVTCPVGAASLAPGASVTCTASYAVTQADLEAGRITNTAVATGTPPAGPPVTSPPSTATVTTVPPIVTASPSPSPSTPVPSASPSTTASPSSSPAPSGSPSATALAPVTPHDGGGTPGHPQGPGAPPLPDTGAQVAELGWYALGLTVAGVGLYLARRRVRRGRHG
ncbi:beta strand repeat-containing protein [Kitasatospora sp. NPDC096147]|uniref:beta strand repeat-containing protein n=1 Tax=Kitasatospora sp. NPDC096147 TaxID=3364093 RepID=UPI003803922A